MILNIEAEQTNIVNYENFIDGFMNLSVRRKKNINIYYLSNVLNGYTYCIVNISNKLLKYN